MRTTAGMSASLIFLFQFHCAERATAQAPPSIQFFMPDGSLPPREIKFTMNSEDGRVNILYTDSRGKFLITRSQGLRPDSAYTVTVESDGSTYDTTSVTFKEYSVYYIPIFLNPLPPKKPASGKTVHVSDLEAGVPEEARQSHAAAMRALNGGDVQEAIRGMQKALRLHPSYFQAMNDLGVVYMKLKRLPEAEAAILEAIKLAPHNPLARLNLGLVRMRQGRNEEALTLLEQIHRDDPRMSEVRMPLGECLLALGRPAEAEEHLRAAAASSGEARYKLGLVLNQLQRHAEALTELREASRLLPESPQIHLQLGGALMQLSRYQEAEQELLTAYRLGGSSMGGAQLLLGQIYFAQAKDSDAIRAFERYLSDVPQAPNAADVRSVIEKLQVSAKP